MNKTGIYKTVVDVMSDEERIYFLNHMEDVDLEELHPRDWPKYEWELLGFYAYLDNQGREMRFEASYSKKIGEYIKKPVIRFHIYNPEYGINISSAVEIKRAEYYYNEKWFPDKLPKEITDNLSDFLENETDFADRKIWKHIMFACESIFFRKRKIPDYSVLN